MPFPRVKIVEKDQTEIAENSQSYNAFYAGFFDRGPENEITKISSILEFKLIFGKPIKDNQSEWFNIYNYFVYGNNCIYLTRVIGELSTYATNVGPFKDLIGFSGISAKTRGSWANNLKVQITETEFKVFMNGTFVESGQIENPESEYIILQDFKTPGTYELYGGLSVEPSTQDIADAYEEFKGQEQINLSLVLANPNYEYPAISLAESRKACVLAFSQNVKNYNDFVCYYYGFKKQKSPFNGKLINVPIIGDIFGLRTYLMNSSGLNVSHCKRTNTILNVSSFELLNLEENYNKCINSLGKMDSNYYAWSEITSTGKQLTNQIILNELTKDLENLSRFFVFEFNDDITRNDFRKKINLKLQNYKDQNYITDFQSVCDLSNQNVSNPNELYIDVYIKQPGIIEEITLRFAASNDF